MKFENEDDQQLYNSLIGAWNKHFSGWDFSFIEKRVVLDPLSWDYQTIVESHLQKTRILLDMGTGGGELLSELNPLPEVTYATEAYPPNYLIALKRLEPLGVKLFKIEEDGKLPFKDNNFDLIINRHEFYLPTEVFRVLNQEGFFITQQVGGDNDNDINRFLGAEVDPQYDHWMVNDAATNLENVGFKILTQKEEFPIEHFYDVEALVYFLKAIPWQVKNFSVDRYFEKLKDISEIIKKQGSFDVANHRFLIVAQK